jgi:O-antigen/teichoic acid export membrane protein
MLGYGLYTLFAAPLWPAYGEALRRGDMHWVRTIYRRCLTLGFAVTLICGISLWFAGDRIISIWTRGEVTHCSRAIVLPLTLMFLVRVLAECSSVLLNGANVLRPQIVTLGLNAILNTALAIALAHRFGAAGVAWSFPITGTATTLWVYPLLVRRVLRSPTAIRSVDQ